MTPDAVRMTFTFLLLPCPFFFLFSFKVLSLMALAALSFIVIYLPHKLFPCQAKKSIILFSSKISKIKVRAILAG